MKKYDKVYPEHFYNTKELLMIADIKPEYKSGTGSKFYQAMTDGEIKYHEVGAGPKPMRIVKGKDLIKLIEKWDEANSE